MIATILGKVLGAAVTLLLAVTLAFFLGRIAGDPVGQMLGEFAPEADKAALRARLGIDRPLLHQYVSYLGDLVRGNLGTSLRYREPNSALIASRFWPSIQLAALALVIGTVVGLVFGVAAALRENSWTDRIVMSGALVGQSVPPFWLGIMLIVVFSVGLGWLPAGQSGSLSNLVLPAITLSTLPLGRIARITRSSVAEILEEPFVKSARARGYSGRRVLLNHVARNAAIPIVTLVGLQAGALLSGAVTVELVFAWPGLGQLATTAVQFRDFELVQAMVVFGAVMFVLINLTVDVVNTLIDPRTRSDQ